jgi:hypothetical protein
MIRLVASCLLAAICVVVLGEQAYRSFTRVRVRVVTHLQAADSASMTVPLPAQASRLPGRPAVILRVRGTSEPLDFTLSLNGRQLTTFHVPPDREVRIDTSMNFVPGAGQNVVLQTTRGGWALTHLELATVHGYSRGALNFVIVPAGAPTDRILPPWMLVVLFVLLAGLRPSLGWRRGAGGLLHRAAAGLVLVLFGVALVAHLFSPYVILLSLHTWLLGLLVLYAEPVSRVWRRPIQLPAFDPRGPRIPSWVTALDVACLVLVALMVRSMLGDSYRMSFPAGITLSLRSWPSIAVWLAVLLAVRQLAWKTLPWHWRVYGWMQAFWRWEPLRAALAPFIVSRAAVVATGFVAVSTFGFNPPRPWRALSNDVLDLFARWDSGWYHGIASSGYGAAFNPQHENAIAFFPGLPILMRVSGGVLDVDLWIAGILVVTVSFLAALTYLYRLARLDLAPEQARASLMFLAFYPFAFCYSAVLTESVFLLAAAATFYYVRRDRFLSAALFGLLAGLLRPNGFLLSVPLGLMALIPAARAWGWLPAAPGGEATSWRRLFVQLAVAAAPVAGMLSYAAHLNALTGDPFAFVAAQQAWGRRALQGFTVLDERSAMIETQGLLSYLRSYPIEMIEAAAALFALGAIWPIVRRFGLAYGVFVAFAVLPPLISMGSVPPAHRPYWIAVFAAGQALMAALFFTWRPPY